MRLILAFFKGVIGPGTWKMKVFRVYFMLGLNFPWLFSIWICSYLHKQFMKYDQLELAIIFYVILGFLAFLWWLRIQNAKRMAQNRAINYLNLHDYDIETRDDWLNSLPKYLKFFIKGLLKIWDYMGYILEKLKRPFRWIKVFFRIK